MFIQGDLIWARTKNYPLWPCIIIKGLYREVDREMYYGIKFLGQSSRTIIKQEDAIEFDINRPEFNPPAQTLKKFRTLKKALQQGEKKMNQKTSKNLKQTKKTAEIQMPKNTKANTKEFKNMNSTSRHKNKNSNKQESKKKQKNFSKKKSECSIETKRIGKEAKSISQSRSKPKDKSESKSKPKLKNKKEEFVFQEQQSSSQQKSNQQVSEYQQHQQQEQQQQQRSSPQIIVPIPKKPQQIESMKDPQQPKVEVQFEEISEIDRKSSPQDQDQSLLYQLIEAGKYDTVIKSNDKQAQQIQIITQNNPQTQNTIELDLPQRPPRKQRIQIKKQKKQQIRADKADKANKEEVIKSSQVNNSQLFNKKRQLKIQQIKFELQSLTFLLLNDSLNLNPIKLKLKQFMNIFQIQSLDIKSVIETKLCSLFSFVKSRLPDQLTQQRTWVQQIINSINNKVVEHINNYDFLVELYKMKKKQEQSKFIQKQQESVPNNIKKDKGNNIQKQSQWSIKKRQYKLIPKQRQGKNKQSSLINKNNQRQYYKQQIKKLIFQCVQHITNSEQTQLQRMLLEFLYSEYSSIDKVWTALKEKMRREKYKSGGACLANITQYINSLL